MSEYNNVVPWYNSNEWHEMYNKVYKEENKEEALHMLLIWKARCPSLPSGIESTLTLLEVHIQDLKSSGDITKDQFLRLAYSSAIMRFVNHMLDTETAKGSSFYHAAKNLGIPDWIIDMRHDTAHSSNLPSIDLLREAAHIGLEWLQKNYWDKYKECIQDYSRSENTLVDNYREMNKVTALLNYCLSLSMCMHSKIKKLSEITDNAMLFSIINDTRDLFGDQIDLYNIKTVSIMSLVNAMNGHLKKCLHSSDKLNNATKTLLGEDSVFLSMELVHYLSDHEFTRKRRLSSNYTQYFELLLTVLHSNDLIVDFVLDLVHITQKSEDNERCILAAVWISEILKALKKSNEFINKNNSIKSRDMRSRKRKDLMSLYHHWFPNDRSKGLLLDLLKTAPSALMSINFVQTIITSYNPYLTYFISDLLNLVEPELPKVVKGKICKLAKLISSPEKLPSASSTIYTVEDLDYSQVDNRMETEDSASNETEKQNLEDACEDTKPNFEKQGLWKLSSMVYDWSTCPIGYLIQNTPTN